MPGITRVGIDSATGLITSTPSNSFARVETGFWAQVGAAVTGGFTMSQGSSFAKINGVAVCFAGNLDSNGVPATGSSNMRVSS